VDADLAGAASSVESSCGRRPTAAPRAHAAQSTRRPDRCRRFLEGGEIEHLEVGIRARANTLRARTRRHWQYRAWPRHSTTAKSSSIARRRRDRDGRRVPGEPDTAAPPSAGSTSPAVTMRVPPSRDGAGTRGAPRPCPDRSRDARQTRRYSRTRSAKSKLLGVLQIGRPNVSVNRIFVLLLAHVEARVNCCGCLAALARRLSS